ncbi:MAG: 8-amino-7-oxononanoate synthase [Nitrospirales bacterium]
MFEENRQKLSRQHLWRELTTIDTSSGVNITIKGQSLLLFASNNYLGLANDQKTKEAAIAAIQRYGVGAGASRLISGSLTPHMELEDQLARFKGTEGALSFSSGYATNIGVIPALINENGLILADRLCHASLLEGCRLSKARMRVFHHNDTDHLKKLLSKRPAKQPTLVVTEGVFSMDGDLAPLSDLVDLGKNFEATVLVDDAHGTGVMGRTGRGTAEHFGIHPGEIFHMGTLSKALGVSGGFIAGPKSLIDYLINTSRPFIFSTASPPAMAAAAMAALHLVQIEPDRRIRLWANRNYLYAGIQAMGFQLTPTESPILPILLKDPERATLLSRALLQEGFFIPAIRPPTVPKGTSRLRLTVTADHTKTQIDACLSALRRMGTDLRIIDPA